MKQRGYLGAIQYHFSFAFDFIFFLVFDYRENGFDLTLGSIEFSGTFVFTYVAFFNLPLNSNYVGGLDFWISYIGTLSRLDDSWMSHEAYIDIYYFGLPVYTFFIPLHFSVCWLSIGI